MIELVHETCRRMQTTMGWLVDFIASSESLLVDDVFIFCHSCRRLDSLACFSWRSDCTSARSIPSNDSTQSDEYDFAELA